MAEFLRRPYRDIKTLNRRENALLVKAHQEAAHYRELAAQVKTELEELKVEIANARVFIPSDGVVPKGLETGNDSPEKHSDTPTE